MKEWEEKATLRGGRTWEPSQGKFSKMPGVDPKRKGLFVVKPEKGFICWDGLPMVNPGPKFYK